MTEDEARICYQEAVGNLQKWIDNGSDSKEDVLEELENDLDAQILFLLSKM